MGDNAAVRVAVVRASRIEGARAITGGMTIFVVSLLVVYLAIATVWRVRAYVEEWRSLNVLVRRMGLQREPFESNEALRRRYLRAVVDQTVGYRRGRR